MRSNFGSPSVSNNVAGNSKYNKAPEVVQTREPAPVYERRANVAVAPTPVEDLLPSNGNEYPPLMLMHNTIKKVSDGKEFSYEVGMKDGVALCDADVDVSLSLETDLLICSSYYEIYNVSKGLHNAIKTINIVVGTITAEYLSTLYEEFARSLNIKSIYTTMKEFKSKCKDTKDKIAFSSLDAFFTRELNNLVESALCGGTIIESFTGDILDFLDFVSDIKDQKELTAYNKVMKTMHARIADSYKVVMDTDDLLTDELVLAESLVLLSTSDEKFITVVKAMNSMEAYDDIKNDGIFKVSEIITPKLKDVIDEINYTTMFKETNNLVMSIYGVFYRVVKTGYGYYTIRKV